MKNVISINSVNKYMNKKKLFYIENLSIKTSSIIGLIGDNGVGKTTFLKMLLGVEKFSSGNITYNETKSDEFFTLIAGSLDSTQLFTNMTGKDNLMLTSKVYNIPKSRINYIINQFNLSNFIKKKVKYYSTGMKKRLLIAISELKKPKILILDEPFTGIDQNSIYTIKKYFLENYNNRCIIITSHVPGDLKNLCTNFIEIKNNIISEQNKIDIDNHNNVNVIIECNDSKIVQEHLKNIGIHVNIISGNLLCFETEKKKIPYISKKIISNDKAEIYQIKYNNEKSGAKNELI